MLGKLIRPKLSLFVSLSAAAGYAAGSNRLTPEILLPALACFLLASGASALNQWQERELDALMSRTRNRPIPSGAAEPRVVVVISVLLLLSGLLLLVVRYGWLSAGLGLLAPLLYNGLYTSLKRRTAFAAIPGAVIGSLGPAIGWAATGNSLNSPALLSLVVLLYLWQVPHFWLLNLKYPHDYSSAGYPCPVAIFGRRRLTRLIVVWTSAAVLASLMLPLFDILHNRGLYIILSAASVSFGLLVAGILNIGDTDERDLHRGFIGINLFVLVTMLLLILDRGLRA